MDPLFVLFLGKAKSYLGENAGKLIRELLFGKEVTLTDIQSQLTSMENSLKELPQDIYDYFVDKKFQNMVSHAKHNVDEKNYEALLTFLDDGKTESYWGLINMMCINMFEVSAYDMELHKDKPSAIKFHKKNGFMQKENRNKIRGGNYPEITDYMVYVTNFPITFSASIAAITLIATKAMEVIRDCEDDEFREACQRRLNNTTTKKYLPIGKNDHTGVNGLASILAPCISYSCRDIIGHQLSDIYMGATQSSGSPDISIRHPRFETSKYKYLPNTGVLNPDLSSTPVSFKLSFADADQRDLAIYSDYAYLYIGEVVVDNSEWGVTFDYEDDALYQRAKWRWYITEYRTTEKWGIVFMFKYGSGAIINSNVLGTKKMLRQHELDTEKTIKKPQAAWWFRRM